MILLEIGLNFDEEKISEKGKNFGHYAYVNL